jgi:hypothetical protein
VGSIDHVPFAGLFYLKGAAKIAAVVPSVRGDASRPVGAHQPPHGSANEPHMIADQPGAGVP